MAKTQLTPEAVKDIRQATDRLSRQLDLIQHHTSNADELSESGWKHIAKTVKQYSAELIDSIRFQSENLA